MLRKARHLRKQIYRYKFTVLVSSAVLERTSGEAGNDANMIVQWSRSGRIVSTQECTHLTHNSSTEVVVRWDEPLSLVATLYKSETKDTFQEKEYTFKIWEVKNKKLSKLLAEGKLDFAILIGIPGAAKQTLSLQPTTSKVKQATLNISVTSQFLESDDNFSDTRSQISAVTFRSTDADALDSNRTRSSIADDNYQNPFNENNPFEEVKYGHDLDAYMGESAVLAQLNQIDEKNLKGETKKLVIDLRKQVESERQDYERNIQSLIRSLADAKLRIAESEFLRAESELAYRKQIASLKLKLMKEQENATRLEVANVSKKMK